jgi:hypothetical protein
VLSDRFELGEIRVLNVEEPLSLTEIEKLYFADNDRILLPDPAQARLLVFDNTGKIIHQIGKKGQGAGEQTSMHDAFVSLGNEEVYILSNDDRSLGVFGLDGSFKHTIKLDFYADGVQPLSSDRLVFYTNYNTGTYGTYNLLITDLNASVIAKYLPYANANTPSLGISGFLAGSPKGVLCSTAFSDSVYRVSAEGVSAAYLFPWGAGSFSDFASKNPMELIMALPNHSYLNRNFVETNDALALKATLGMQERLYFHHQKTGTWTHSEQFDKRSLLNYFSAPLASKGDWMYSLVQSEKIAERLKEDPDIADFWKAESSELSRLFTQNFNPIQPIVVAYRLRP